MRRFLNGLAVLQEWLAATGLLLITGLVVIAVIFRYWLQARHPLPGRRRDPSFS